MRTGISLKELAEKLDANSQAKKDFVVQTQGLTLDASNHMLVPGNDAYALSQIAHQQLAGYTGIPRQYYEKMMSEAPGLLRDNVNTWLRQKKPDDMRMVRTQNGRMRALLSNRYQRIENEEVASAALTVLSELNGVEIVSSEITERRLYIHFTVNTIQGEVKKGDVVQAGGIISNSEVGLGSASVSGMIWRLVCLNGLKVGETYRRTHVGRKIEDNEELWADDTRQTDDKLVLMRIRDTVRALTDEARFRTSITRLQDLSQLETKGDPVKAVEVLSKKIGATEAESSGILRSLINGADLTAWGLVNAVTAQAHTAPEYDRAVELESRGGRLVDLPKTEWREILEAA